MDNCVIKDVADAFQEHQTDSVYGDLIYVSNRNISRIIRYWNAGEYKKSLFERGWMVPHPSFFVKREIYEKCGNFNTGYRISADYEMMLRLLYMHEISTHYMKRTLVKMRIGGISNKYPLDFLRKMAEDFEICKAYNIREPYATVFLKNVRKIPQFF
jgi:glycosyltransferase